MAVATPALARAWLRIHAADNVAVALRPLKAGEQVADVTTAAAIPAGHKVALRPIARGEPVVKYGFSIGVATDDIAPGEHVHSHNLASGLSDNLDYRWNPNSQPASEERESPEAPASTSAPTFQGFRRANGQAAIRNEIWIINTVGCVNITAQRIADRAGRELVRPGGAVEGVFTFTHPFGCSQLGDDLTHTQAILAGLIRHPNAAGVLVLGLGCENNQLEKQLQASGEYDPGRLRFFNAQQVPDEIEHGLGLIAELAEYATRFQRQPIAARELILAMKCGGSDGFSGMTANPVVGRLAERHCGWGGTTLLSEVPEMFGAETLLMDRAVSRAAFDDTVRLINDFKDYFRRHQQPVYENPSPGNKDGGITTLEEKSLGCVQKGGAAPVAQVLQYGQPASAGLGGLALVQSPGNDAVSCTAMAAAGAHIVLFTTGRGTPLGVPTPTLKIASNTDLAERKPGWIDFNAGRLLTGDVPLDTLADDLLGKVLAIASGEPTQNERNGYREIAIWKSGVTL